MEQTAIKKFDNKYKFLSNFSNHSVKYRGIRYLSAEAAFQAQKCADPKQAKDFSDLLPGSAKRLGRKVKLRKDWDQIKEGVMFYVLQAKFDQHEWLRERLIDTGDAELIEGNTWGDTYWGVCKGEGENRLGYILSVLRHRYIAGGALEADEQLRDSLRAYEEVLEDEHIRLRS